MRWEKLGLIYSPDGRSDWMRTHAAVPCAEQVSGDLFRVYFSGRDRLNRSHVGFIEIDILRPSRVLRVSSEPVLSLGRLGTFDDSGVMLTWIAHAEGRDFAYYVGWNLAVTVPFHNAIGLAIKKGTDFRRFAPGPIIDRAPEEPYFTASCCVLRDDTLWKMWYLSATGWDLVDGRPRHSYHIKYAESKDGINWVRPGIVCIDFKSTDEYAISRPSVLKDGGLFRMWYSVRGQRYRIGYAESVDGESWTRKDAEVGIDVSRSGWDAEMIEYPFVFDHAGERYMLYNGNGYGASGFGLARLIRD